MAAKFVWHGLKKDVDWVAPCIAYQRAKVLCHSKAPLKPFIVLERRFDHVYVDLIGPLPLSLLTIVVRTTCWPEAIPLQTTLTADIARAFLGTLVARFGVPSDITSDQSCHLAVASSLGVQLQHTMAYHPQANGQSECFHRSLKAALRASLQDDCWVDRLPWVLLGLRTSPKEDLFSSSAELVYGQPLRVPGDFLPYVTCAWSAAQQRHTQLERSQAFTSVPTSQHRCMMSRVLPRLQEAAYVFVHHDAHRGS